MIIAIDGYEANQTRRVGIGEYAYQTLVNLYTQVQKKTTINVRVYLPESPLPDMPKESIRWNYLKKTPKKLWTFGALPAGLMTTFPKADIVFSPTHYIPRFVTIPRVMSIMDLSFLSYPELFKKKDYYQLVNWTEYSVKHARAVFTISEFSRNAIIKQYSYDPERVFVTYPGLTLDKSMRTSVNIEKKYSLNRPFILSVGTIQPRKNFEKLIEAFSQLKKKKEYTNLDLVIVGKKGWLFEPILAAPEKFNIKESVHFLDFVPDEDLPSLYKQAECFVLPSLYEGFGLPVLEAMANSCMVVVSKVSSLPEIAGDVGIYVEPDSVESIAGGIEQVFEEKRTKKKEKRIELGLKRVKMFSWEKAAEQTLDILEKVGTGEL